MKTPTMDSTSLAASSLLSRLSALAAACALLGGCAALQIDVDVYKGPLVHDEETQVQQLASIAMSGKAVMLLQRNNWLDETNPGWRANAAAQAQHNPGKQLRTRHISADEWTGLNLCTDEQAQCRNARLINDMLSAYQDRVEPVLAQPLEDTRSTYKAYTSARDAYERAVAKKEAVLEAKTLERTNEALRQTWGGLADLLYETKRLMPATNDAAFKAIERQAAEILAKLTEPAYLFCAAAVLPPAGELQRVMAQVNQVATEGWPVASQAAKEAGAQRAIRLINGALRMAQADEVRELRRAMNANVVTPCDADPRVPTLNTGSAKLNTMSPRQEVRAPGASRLGVQREAVGGTGAVVDKDLREIDELWGDLMQLGASGFDRGRPQLGLDRLADEAATDRFKDRRSERAVGNVAGQADGDQTKQLQDSVVDLASRMQFLAVNMRLVDSSSSGSGQAFKATLETIANSLLVLAEDQRRQRQHREHQKSIADEEYAAAVDAFKLDPGRRFDQLTSAISTRLAKIRTDESKDTASAQRKAVLDATLATTHAELKTAEDSAARRAASLQELVALRVTLEGEAPKGLPTSSVAVVMGLSKDAPAQWKADKAGLDSMLKAAAAKTTVQALRNAITEWLDAEFKERDSTATKADPRQLRLQAASAALVRFKTAGVKEMLKAEAVKEIRQDLATALGNGQAQLLEATASVSELRSKLTQTQADQVVLEQVRKGKLAAEGEALAGTEVDAALILVRALRPAVLAEAATNKGAHEVNTIRDLVNTKLEQGKAAATADKQTAFQAALTLVSQWASSQPAAIKPGNSREAKAVDTLDRVEAYLSYARVEATHRGGAAGDGVKEASEALAALMQRRERMSYLRPASMYLRSALATTGQQSDPALEWRNLLGATIKRLLSYKTSDERKTAEVRADLDKSFWQSVNQVRVSAGGDSNFAIAKDDVGNWYVKAMGTDSAAMLSAAKNLALYNLGGRIDTNLLRIDELRNKLGRQPDDADDTELKDLLDRKSGAADSAYGSTLKVFSDNHTQTVKALQASLDNTLKMQAHFDQLRARWAKTYADSSTRLEIVKQALVDPALLSLHEKALATVAPVDPQPVGTTPSSQLLETLDLLAQQRARVRSLLAQMDTLTKDETASADAQKKVVADQEAILTAAQNEQTALLQKRQDLQDQISKLTSDKLAEAELLTRELNDIQKLANEKGLQVVDLRTKLLEARAASARLSTMADAAQALKARAFDDVDQVLHKLLKDTAAKQLRAVEEFETAARVVSQGVQGKASRP